MKPLFLDFETHWSDDYTLKRMTPVEYILDPRFEALGCAFAGEQGDPEWVDGPMLPAYFATVDWSKTFTVSHNALFDMLILSMRYGVKPAMYGDTLSMARNWISYMTDRVSLDAVSKFYGMPPKWDTVTRTKGITFHMLSGMPELHRETAAYACDDCGKCRSIFKKILASGFPPRELKVIDLVVKMAAQPVLMLDQQMLIDHLADVQREKQALLDNAQLTDRVNLMRDKVFATMLMQEGVIPPMKRSKTTGEDVYAFAKTDREFTQLLEHERPMVQALVAARLGHKSTLEETRTERLLAISRVTLLAPVPLKYSGAHTHRFSGDWKINMQNLARGSKIRMAIKAPKDKKVVSADASQIEARINAVLSGQWDLVEDFRNGIDVYAKFAETVYQYPVSKATRPRERLVGKVGILSLGYGSGPPVFQNMCRVQGDVILNLSEATSIVFLYRQRYRQIVLNWDWADKVVLPMLAGEPVQMAIFADDKPSNWKAWGPIGIMDYALLLPSLNRLRYRDLHKEVTGGKTRWVYMRGKMPHTIYGPKLVENAVQALAFIHIMEVAMRIHDRSNGQLRPAHQVHDELIYVVDDADAELVRDLLVDEMATPPSWMPLAPLAAEGHIGQSYGEAK